MECKILHTSRNWRIQQHCPSHTSPSLTIITTWINTSVKLPDFLLREFAKIIIFCIKLNYIDRIPGKKIRWPTVFHLSNYPLQSLHFHDLLKYMKYEIAKIVPELLSYIPSLQFCMSISMLAFTPKISTPGTSMRFRILISPQISDMGCWKLQVSWLAV